VTTATASARGRANRNKGATAERDLVRWLRDHGWPGAERYVRTGYRTATRTSADPGDVTGTPGLAWQVKNRADFDKPSVLAACLAETEQQRAAENADFGLLVQRRPNYPIPADWWVWLGVLDLHRLLTPSHRNPLSAGANPHGAPLRMSLGGLVPLLHAAGYGTGPEAA
jgi:hypothetical protein